MAKICLAAIPGSSDSYEVVDESTPKQSKPSTQKNSFYFEGGTILPRWSEIVPPARLSLIRHITLESPTCCWGRTPSVQVWSDMIKAAKGLKRLQSVTAILLPCVCNYSAVLDLLYPVQDAEVPALEILYQFAHADSTKGSLKGLGADGVFEF
ncbi:uncharacterized protein N7473_006400 [Penicillium subrubescens]|uniref:Uncharacterized protein n=1 Tax=Penicillium subrubescens TaxID=1316194 RepID=A0A1Q5URI2_9EURO|nr:uncharacterized protein N7473_006400 [Penicillium subrubescens]KAJ5897001.1 hypothetical protein N7473_006400 [Penicillium subrubescens]OKP15076.1 hypothetical protein PENSUB_3057 [Penicillium subrubescens]